MYLARHEILSQLLAIRRKFRKMLDRSRKLRWTCRRKKSRSRKRRQIAERCMQERGAFVELFMLLPEVRVTGMRTGARRMCDSMDRAIMETKYRSLSGQREFWPQENAS